MTSNCRTAGILTIVNNRQLCNYITNTITYITTCAGTSCKTLFLVLSKTRQAEIAFSTDCRLIQDDIECG